LKTRDANTDGFISLLKYGRGRAVLDLLSRIFDTAAGVLFPPRCLACKSFFQPEEIEDPGQPGIFSRGFGTAVRISAEMDMAGVFKIVMARFLCAECLEGFQAVESPVCPMCGMMFKSREEDDHLCGECVTLPKKFMAAGAAGVYSGTLMELVHSFKYRGKIQLRAALGLFLFTGFIRRYSRGEIDFIVPVPLHAKRFRQRGFNQAYLMIKNWPDAAAAMGIKRPDVDRGRDVLERSRETDSQAGLGRKDRMANIKGAFRLKNPSVIEGKRILLVDDVYTTGATVNECADVLLKGGAERVDVFTLARGIW